MPSLAATVEEIEQVEWSGLSGDLPEPLFPSLLFPWDELFFRREIQPKPFQINTANAFLLRQDTILCVPSGTGKGVIFDMLPAANPEGIYVVMMPLKALEEEMTISCAFIWEVYGVRELNEFSSLAESEIRSRGRGIAW